MDKQSSFWGRRTLLATSVAAAALIIPMEGSVGQTSEIDSYDQAVRSQSAAQAVAFVKFFRSSHLVGDLIESLPPDVARQVCDELGSSSPARARKACAALPSTLAEQPMPPTPGAKPPAEVAPAASPAPAASEPDTAAEGPSRDTMEPIETRSDSDAAERDGDGVFLPPPIAPAPAVVKTPESSVSNSTDAHPSEELVAGQVSGTNADGSSPTAGQFVYLPVANLTPAAGPAPDGAILNSVEAPKARPYSSGSGDTDKSRRVGVTFLPLGATRPMKTLTPAASIPTTTEVSAASPADAASTDESSAAQRSAGKAQGKSVQSGADPQSDQSSSASDSSSRSTSGSESGSDQSSGSSSNTSKSDKGKSDSSNSTPGSDSKSGNQSNSDNSSTDQGIEGQQSADQSGSEQSGSSDASNNDKNGKAKGGNSGKGKNGKGDGGKGKKGGGKSG